MLSVNMLTTNPLYIWKDIFGNLIKSPELHLIRDRHDVLVDLDEPRPEVPLPRVGAARVPDGNTRGKAHRRPPGFLSANLERNYGALNISRLSQCVTQVVGPWNPRNCSLFLSKFRCSFLKVDLNQKFTKNHKIHKNKSNINTKSIFHIQKIYLLSSQ